MKPEPSAYVVRIKHNNDTCTRYGTHYNDKVPEPRRIAEVGVGTYYYSSRTRCTHVTCLHESIFIRSVGQYNNIIPYATLLCVTR